MISPIQLTKTQASQDRRNVVGACPTSMKCMMTKRTLKKASIKIAADSKKAFSKSMPWLTPTTHENMLINISTIQIAVSLEKIKFCIV